MIDARKMDRTIAVQRQGSTMNADREMVSGWTTVATVAAQRLDFGTREYRRSYGTSGEGSGVFRVRFIPGITTADRILFEGDALNVVEVIELGRRRGLDLRVGP